MTYCPGDSAEVHVVSDLDLDTVLPEEMKHISRQVRVLHTLTESNLKNELLSTNVQCFDLYTWHEVSEFERHKGFSNKALIDREAY